MTLRIYCMPFKMLWNCAKLWWASFFPAFLLLLFQCEFLFRWFFNRNDSVEIRSIVATQQFMQQQSLTWLVTINFQPKMLGRRIARWNNIAYRNWDRAKNVCMCWLFYCNRLNGFFESYSNINFVEPTINFMFACHLASFEERKGKKKHNNIFGLHLKG